MTKQIHSTDTAPAAIGPYNQAVEANGFVFCSGQIPLTADGSLVQGTVAEQTQQVMTNIRSLLGSMGLSFENVVKTTIFISDMAHFATVNEIYAQAFEVDFPARSTVAVAGLPKGVDVEIEVICAR